MLLWNFFVSFFLYPHPPLFFKEEKRRESLCQEVGRHGDPVASTQSGPQKPPAWAAPAHRPHCVFSIYLPTKPGFRPRTTALHIGPKLRRYRSSLTASSNFLRTKDSEFLNVKWNTETFLCTEFDIQRCPLVVCQVHGENVVVFSSNMLHTQHVWWYGGGCWLDLLCWSSPVCANTASLCCTPETKVRSYINYTSIF